MNKATSTIFKDLKVLELASVLAGPSVGTFFTELGANVTKIENKNTNGDVTRSWKTKFEDKDSPTSSYYASVNWNKKVVFLDLKDEKQRLFIYDLVKDVDVVISNYKSGDDKKLGVDYDTLKALNPNLIYAHLTGFGEDDDRTAFDLVLQAETGFMSINGTKQSGPIKIPIALIDVLAAHQMKEAILVALIKRMKDNKGSKINVSLYDAAISSLVNQASSWLMTGHNPEPIGSLHPSIAPYGEIFTTKDNHKIVLAIGSSLQFKKLAQILDVSNLIGDPKFSKNSDRVVNRKLLFDILQEKISNKNADELMEKFVESQVPAGKIKTIEEVFSDIKLKNFILSEYQYEIETKRVRTVVFTLND